MGLNGIRMMHLFMGLSILSLSVQAEVDSPSFYGKRSVAPIESETAQEPITFQRRTIVITSESNNTEETSLDSILAIDIVNRELIPSVTDNKIEKQKNMKVRPLLELSRNEKLLAKKAHYYFERNWNKNTGLTDSVQGYHHVTMWDVASDISAQLSLEALQLQSPIMTNQKLEMLLNTLINFPLYKDKLPNREYSTITALPSGKYSQTKTNGNGWSALDIGRLLIWLNIIKQEKKELAFLVDQIEAKWSLTSAVHNQTLYGTKLSAKSEHYRQEGRLGYLQYAASGFALFGFDVSKSYQNESIEQVMINGIPFYIDARNMPFSTSDPYILTRLELGEFTRWWEQLDTVYSLHKMKAEKTNKVWIFAEDAMNRTPWFAYNNLYFYGKSWLSTSAGGKPVENFQIFSNKAALGFGMIYDDQFANELVNQVIDNSLYSRSIPTGVYSDGLENKSYNINTNSMVLSSLLFKIRHKTAMLNNQVQLEGMMLSKPIQEVDGE